MSERTRRSVTLLWVALFLCSLLMQYGSFASPASVLAASGLLAGTVQGFEIDGDLDSGNASTNPAAVPDGPPPPGEPDLVDTLTNGDDWLDGASGSGVIDPPSPPDSALVNDPTDDQSDDIFIGGAKEDDTCTWGYTTGKPTPKDDFDHVMAYAKFVGTNAYFYAGAERFHTVGGGDTTIDFELNRNVFRSFNGGPLVADRSVGDLLISLEFANGGSNPEVRIFQVTSVTPCDTGEKVVLTEKSNAQVANAVHSATNFGPVGGFSGAGNADPIATFDFAEISIDLHALGIDPSCPGFAAGHIRSRAGGDINSSQLKDTSAPFPIDLNTCGQVTIVKDAVPNDAQDFAFSGDLGAFSLDDDSNGTLPNSTTFTDVAPGTYDVTEAAVTGWDLTNLVCNDANSVEDLGTRNAEIHLEANEHVTCTFTNTQRGSITIVKDAQPDDDDDFPFTTTGSGLSSFSLDDDANATLPNSTTFNNLVPGAYTVTEGAVAGWDLVNLVCTDLSGGTTTNLGTRTASIGLAAGENVTCTYTNAKRGSVVIIKNAIPDDGQDFSFSTSGGDLTPTTFSLEDNGDELDGSPNTRTFSFVTSGAYTVTEDGETGWDLTGISCDDPTSDSSGNVGTGIASINVSNGETVTCTFTNTKRGRIIVDKVTVPGGDPQSFSFDATGAGYSDFSLTDAADPNSQEVLPGEYSVAETVPTGWDLTGATCDQGETPEDIDVGPGETVICTFTNTKRGSLTVVKNAVPDSATDFSYSATESTDTTIPDFQLDDDGDGTLPNQRLFSNLKPGTYSVTEATAAGWNLTGLTCTDGSPTDLGTRTATVTITAGENVTCTFTNTQLGSITIIKDARPNDPQDFSYTGLGGFILDDDGDESNGVSSTFVATGLSPGSYDVTETLVGGWTLTNLVCNDPDPGTTIDGATAHVDLDAGQTITCTYTNVKDATVTIVKDAVPNDAQDFGYTGSFGAFSLDDDANATLSNSTTFTVPAAQQGAKSVTETTVAGWSLTNIDCTGTTETIDGATASFTVNPGDSITCTYTNVKDATVTIVKDAVPNDAQDFGYTGSFGAFSLDDDANATLSNSTTFTVPAAQQGAKSVTETTVAGWDLTDLDCVGDDDSSIDGATANLIVEPGETITCTYENTKRGHILVDKVTNPSADPAVFDFDASGVGYADFTLTDAASPNDSGGLVPGAYSVEELDEAGWDLTGLTCDDANGSVSLLTGTASLTLDPGETINCTFTNTKRATIIVVKDAVPDSAQDFAFTTTGAGLSGFSLDDDADATLSNSRTFTNLVPGEYSVTETDPGSAWDLGALDCTEGTANSSEDLATATADITLDPGETVTCTFVNVQRGSITIIKDALPDGPTNFSYTGSFGAFQLDDDADPSLSNTISFVDQLSGEYSVAETLAAGWDLDAVVCNGTNGSGGVRDGNAADITLTDGGSVTCTFTNRLPAIQVVKTAGSAADGAVLVAAPGNVTYTYVVTNTGQTVLNGISVVDDNGTPANPADDFAATCPKTTLAIGESMTCTATVSVTANRTNIALAEGTSPGGNDVSDTDDAVVRVPGTSIDKSHNDADGVVGRGQEVTYTILATISQGPVTNAVITDTLPAGQTYVGGSQTSAPAATSFAVSADGRTLTWTYASLSTGATLTYKVTIDAGAPTGNQTNTVQICVSELPGCPSDTTTVRVPTLTILKGVTGNTAGSIGGVPQAKEGDTLTFTLTYDLTNGPVTGGVVTDVLPVGYSYVAGSATSSTPGAEFTFTSFDAGTRTLTWNAPTVTQDGSVSYRVVVLTGAAELPQPLINVATIDSTETNPDDDDQPVLVQVPPLAATATPRITPPPTDLEEQAPSNPGFTLMLVLLALAGFVLTVGYLTPVPERARRRDRR